MLRWIKRNVVCRLRGHVARVTAFDVDEQDGEWLPFAFCARCWKVLPAAHRGWIKIGEQPQIDTTFREGGIP